MHVNGIGGNKNEGKIENARYLLSVISYSFGETAKIDELTM